MKGCSREPSSRSHLRQINGSRQGATGAFDVGTGSAGARISNWKESAGGGFPRMAELNWRVQRTRNVEHGDRQLTPNKPSTCDLRSRSLVNQWAVKVLFPMPTTNRFSTTAQWTFSHSGILVCEAWRRSKGTQATVLSFCSHVNSSQESPTQSRIYRPWQ